MCLEDFFFFWFHFVIFVLRLILSIRYSLEYVQNELVEEKFKEKCPKISHENEILSQRRVRLNPPPHPKKKTQ